jgi:monovalent cation/hydrogen antiporter
VGGLDLLLVSLLVAVAALAAVARRLNVPYPIVLVVGGAVLGVLPTLSNARLDPDLVLVVFLPPLLYSGAFFANLRELRADMRTISLLSIGLVLATMVAVAVTAHALIDDLPWAACFALGAIVAPTDPAAAIAIAGRLGVPRRVVAILEGESLVNDAVALVAYSIAVHAASKGGEFSLWHAAGQFVVDAGGGVAIGLVVGFVIAEVRRRIEDPLIENTISLLSGYAAYVPAEHVGVSAVLAAVTCGIYIGWRAPLIAAPATRLQGFSMWELLVFLLNATLFVLVGLQLPHVLHDLGGHFSAELIGYAALVSAVVIVTRLVWQHTIVFVVRALDRRASQRARRGSWRQRTLIGWSGMRGAVSLAAALALPDNFPERSLLVFLTFSVIFATLVLQGLTLPTVIRWLHVEPDDGEDREELKARLLATKAALARLEDLAAEDWTRDDTVERMVGLYRYRKNRLAARAGKVEDDGYEDCSVAYQTMVREVLEAQRREIVRLRNEGVISNDVMHRIERELDLEDQRLEI